MPGILSITTPPATSQLTLLATAKGDLGVTATTDDTYITNLINRASSVVAEHCGRALGLQTAAEIFRFGAGSYIGPSAQSVAPYGTPLAAQFKPISFTLFPIVALTTIAENSDPKLTQGTDFDLDAPAALAYRIRNGLRSWWGVPTVTATYTAGWQLPGDDPATGVPPLPGAVEEIVLTLIRNTYLRRGRDPALILDMVEGVGRQGYAPVQKAFGMAIDADMAAILQPYRAVAW